MTPSPNPRRDHFNYNGCLLPSLTLLQHPAMLQMSGEEYLTAARDPIAQFSAPVCGHMNDDHGEDMKAMIK